MNIATDDKCKEQFDNLKYRKIDGRYIVFNVINERIVVERVGKRQQNWDTFLESMPDKQYRYAVFDFQFTNKDNMNISKIIFINWSPDGTPMKSKVLYATAKQSFKKYLDINTKDYILNSRNDMTQKDMIKELCK